MRILVGYDGSVPADGALYDLSEAGLPSSVEALVLTAAATWAPFGPGGDPAARGSAIGRDDPGTGAGEGGHAPKVREYSRQALEDAGSVAERGARFLREEFPLWKVGSVGVLDDTAHAVLERAESWNADLVVLGSPGRSLLGRFLGGSVTQKVLHHARADLRIGRPRIGDRYRAPLLLLAMDGSPGAEQALRALSARRWIPETVVRVVAAVEGREGSGDVQAGAEPVGLLPGKPALAVRKRTLAWIEEKVERACSLLSSSGLRAVPAVVAGDPRRVLLEECREWEPRALFMGARGLNPVARFALGSVSAALASAAPCTVEVHHQKRMSARNLADRPSPNRKSRRQR